ncbi:MAG: hypothetical protein E7Z65_04460 [Thermoplasmata archaeon]|jgi:hypothetical protein|nr:hypothetical protein [Thermoplasmata archaeon]
MSDIPYNSLKARSIATQLRTKLEQKLLKKLGEKRVIGPLDPLINRAFDEGHLDEQTRDTLFEISAFCEKVLLTSDMLDVPPFQKLLEWSNFVGELWVEN